MNINIKYIPIILYTYVLLYRLVYLQVQKSGRNLKRFNKVLLYRRNFNRPLTESRQSGMMYNRILFEYYIIIIINIILLLLYAMDIKMRLTSTRYQLCNLQ